jgi:hypothetical protein
MGMMWRDGGETNQEDAKRAFELEAMLTISSDASMGMSKDDHQVVRRLATRDRLDRRPRYVCGMCGYAVYAPREGLIVKAYRKSRFVSEICLVDSVVL